MGTVVSVRDAFYNVRESYIHIYVHRLTIGDFGSSRYADGLIQMPFEPSSL